MADINLLFESFEFYKSKGDECIKTNKLQAKRYYMQAAETMLKISQASEGQLKKTRFERAKKLLDYAESLGQEAPKAKKEEKQEVKVQENEKLSLEEVLEKLNKLEGLTEVKQKVNDWVDQIKVFNLRKQRGLSVPTMSYHMVFMGNPGTGKTTVARLMSQIYCALGVVSQGHLVEVDRGALVAGFVGQTAIKTKEVIEKAIGGVLFIDEAYMLSKNAGNDFGGEAIDTILKAMEDNRDNLVVIVAGYTDLMHDFIDSNPGLQSRFKNYVDFADYSGKEMYNIFTKFCLGSQYEIDPQAKTVLQMYFDRAYKTRDKNFGNARDVRNLFEQIVTSQSKRVVKQPDISNEELMVIKLDDLPSNVMQIIDLYQNSAKETTISEPILNSTMQTSTIKIAQENIQKQEVVEEKKEEKPSYTLYTKPYEKPSTDLLFTQSESATADSEKIEAQIAAIESTLKQFGVQAKVVNTICGAAVTKYEIEIPQGVSVKSVLKYESDLALNLASNGDIRIEAPIPGKKAIGIEVPNDKIYTVALKDLLNTPNFKESQNALEIPVGNDVEGKPIMCNLARMPHLLVAGTTGSGKSVFLSSLILSLIFRNSPQELKLILIDPKRVEFSMFGGLGHMHNGKVLTENQEALEALEYAAEEMERRYVLLQSSYTKNIEEYNSKQSDSAKKLPYIVVVVDEFADFRAFNKKQVEEVVSKLACKSRAAGIYMVVATQRPSVDVLSGSIKNNFPSRISFALPSANDSKTVLDRAGAEMLLGKGDMLYYPTYFTDPIRVQGAYVTTDEILNVINFLKS